MLLRLLLKWVLDGFVLLVVTWIVPGFEVANFGAALVAVLVIGLLNVTLGLLLKLVFLPLGILTLGLVFLLINALMIKMAGAIVPGFRVKSVWSALVGAFALALIHVVFHVVLW
ncbi:MAG: phage holin family protein [Acidobacteriaceae bacterium]